MPENALGRCYHRFPVPVRVLSQSSLTRAGTTLEYKDRRSNRLDAPVEQPATRSERPERRKRRQDAYLCNRVSSASVLMDLPAQSQAGPQVIHKKFLHGYSLGRVNRHVTSGPARPASAEHEITLPRGQGRRSAAAGRRSCETQPAARTLGGCSLTTAAQPVLRHLTRSSRRNAVAISVVPEKHNRKRSIICGSTARDGSLSYSPSRRRANRR